MAHRPILLIEDNEQNRYLATFLLEQHGYTVVAAPDGPRGIAAAQEHGPSMILLDIQLPHMDGYSVARALRAITTLRETPIVAVTSYAMPGDREKALDAGCTGYVEKPIDPDTFLSSLLRYGLPPRPMPSP
jgi:CheY-like chemotaxis protein